MNEREEQSRQIEIDIETAKDKIAMVDALIRLRKNKDFKRVFIDGFSGTEAIRVVKALADPACQDPSTQALLQARISAVGVIEQYMIAIERIGEMSRRALNDYENDLVELADEEA